MLTQDWPPLCVNKLPHFQANCCHSLNCPPFQPDWPENLFSFRVSQPRPPVIKLEPDEITSDLPSDASMDDITDDLADLTLSRDPLLSEGSLNDDFDRLQLSDNDSGFAMEDGWESPSNSQNSFQWSPVSSQSQISPVDWAKVELPDVCRYIDPINDNFM